ncbi:hypothetical protein JZ751_000076 [Albula glossodonta]|uniref:Proline-rich protein PRCC n=1 Tax=Albula glossodonta TaxID=121402 RepID=A0A8T2PVD1_9TELE|nr:hypothetical protein JZ751_000076 [Albula glossodonta]
MSTTETALYAFESDSDEEEPVSKKALSQASGGGLSSLLPQPRNLVVKETQRALVPHALTKRPQETRGPARPTGAAPGPPSATSPSPSAIKAAAKSAALQLARQIAQDDEGSDEELAPENYFSLPDSSQPPPVMPALDPDPPAGATLPLPPGTEAPFQSDAPLDFASTPQNYPGGSSGAWEGHQQESYYPRYPESASHGPQQEQFSQDYYSGAYYQDPDPGVTEMEQPGSSSLFDDEAFRRLQGKRNRGKEEVKFLEIKGDDQLSGSQQWMTKSMTEEKEQRKSFSKAKERELELKNSWAENKLTRRQTQAKYGFYSFQQASGEKRDVRSFRKTTPPVLSRQQVQQQQGHRQLRPRPMTRMAAAGVRGLESVPPTPKKKKKPTLRPGTLSEKYQRLMETMGRSGRPQEVPRHPDSLSVKFRALMEVMAGSEGGSGWSLEGRDRVELWNMQHGDEKLAPAAGRQAVNEDPADSDSGREGKKRKVERREGSTPLTDEKEGQGEEEEDSKELDLMAAMVETLIDMEGPV